MSQATTGCPYANDPRTRYDALHREPLTRDDNGRWVVVRHADAVAVVTDPETFSSHVSRFLQVPNGLDGTAHREAADRVLCTQLRLRGDLLVGFVLAALDRGTNVILYLLVKRDDSTIIDCHEIPHPQIEYIVINIIFILWL